MRENEENGNKVITVESLMLELQEKKTLEEFQSSQIDSLNELIRLKDNHINNLEKIISDKDVIIANFQKREEKRERWSKIFLVGYLVKGLRKLKRFLKKVLKSNNFMTRTAATWLRCIRHPKRAFQLYYGKKGLHLRSGCRLLDVAYFKYGPLEIPVVESPQASIVIPVYNQLEYTIHCIYSIMENTHGVSYEIIIADDVSTDGTETLGMYSDSIKIVRNSSNMGFLRNCNHAAMEARGKYIVFLNNDTQVRENWLSALVSLIESDETIGMVGSKLLYPNGVLQEAGGIIWKDGNGWNYGRNQDPSMPEYNYVKEVDYISGAAIMLKRELWEMIGGFDEEFAPAYYEDTDLAFQIRQRGYKVMYQPLSEVVHFEGVSNGVDVSAGLKRYQVENAEKFYRKWKRELLENAGKDPSELFIARDRAVNRKIVLFIDHYVPHFDQDAGSKSTLAYIKAFLSMGYRVKFIGDNFYKHEPYTSALQQMGVEVLYGDWYFMNWKTWLKENGKYIDVVFTNRPHISIKYMDVLRTYTNAKILYYGHDLHYVRETREAELEHDKELLEHAKMMKNMEYSVMSKADTVYYPSYVEIDIIKKENPNIKARAIPVYVYENPNNVLPLPLKERRDLLFVGGFGHAPNADAVLWFVKEIFPKVLAQLPDVKLYIIGSKAPQEILELASEHVVILGFVSEEELLETYRKCRIDVVPLRYGAGMKGKVIEAIYNKIPLITTSIGAEGLQEYEEVLAVRDSAEDFANSVIELYQDEEAMQKMINSSEAYIKKYFSLDAAIDIIQQDL